MATSRVGRTVSKADDDKRRCRRLVSATRRMHGARPSPEDKDGKFEVDRLCVSAPAISQTVSCCMERTRLKGSIFKTKGFTSKVQGLDLQGQGRVVLEAPRSQGHGLEDSISVLGPPSIHHVMTDEWAHCLCTWLERIWQRSVLWMSNQLFYRC